MIDDDVDVEDEVEIKKQSKLDKIRKDRKRDNSPSWLGSEEWDADTFRRNYHHAIQYYNVEKNIKELKPFVVTWMSLNSFTVDEINSYKKSYDWRTSNIVGGIACCLLNGMPEIRNDFNSGRNTASWLRKSLENIIQVSIAEDQAEVKEEKIVKPKSPVNIEENSLKMLEELDDAIERWSKSPETFSSKQINVVNFLARKESKPHHAKFIKAYYKNHLDELSEVLSPKDDDNDQLKESYSSKTRAQIKELYSFLVDIDNACSTIIKKTASESKVKKIKKLTPEQLVAKLKYQTENSNFELKSLNPTNIINSKELWCFDTSTRKLIKYIGKLSVKGSTIIGFDEKKSAAKTLRSPKEQLLEIKKCNAKDLNLYYNDIDAVEIKASGKINENQIILKIF
jgi:hypothetical protein